MAGIAISVGDTGGGGSAGSAGDLGGILGDAFDAATGGDTPDAPDAPVPDAPGEPGADDAPADQPLETPPDESAGTDAVGAPADTSASPWPLSEDGQTVLMPRADLDRVRTAMTFSEQVGQFFTSPQEAQAVAGQASDLRQITNDWLYGSDSTIQSFMNHWLGANHADPGVRQSCQKSFAKMLGMGVQAIRSLDPQAHSALSGEMFKSHLGGMYEKAAQAAAQYGPESDVAKQALLDAQAVDWGLNGSYQKELPKVDPDAQRRQEFERQQAEFNARQESALRRDVQDFSQTSVEGEKFKQLSALADKALEKIRPRLNAIAYQDLRAGVLGEVQRAVAARSDWWTEHRQTYDSIIRDYQHTWSQGTPGRGLQPRVQAYIASFMREAQRVLPAIAARRVSANTRSSASASPSPGSSSSASSRSTATAPRAPSRENGHRWTRDDLNNELSNIFRGR